MEKLEIFNCPCLATNSESELKRFIYRLIVRKKGGYSVAINAEKVIKYNEDTEMKEVINNSVLPTIDGGGISLGLRIIHKEFYKRIDLPKLILELADEKMLRLFFFGAKEEINQKAVENIKVKYLNIKIVGRQNGYYEDIGDIIKRLKETKPQVAFVALGSPKQELLSAKLHKLLNGIIFIGCGGALDVFGGKEKRPPAIIGDNHLEWLYRLIMNPKRIIRQKVLPKYLFHIIKARLKRNNYID